MGLSRRAARSKRPLLSATAPVNAPFSWPNSSLSIRFPGRAPQFTLMYGPSLRGDEKWIASAIISLPVPVSPRRSTVSGGNLQEDFVAVQHVVTSCRSGACRNYRTFRNMP